MIRGFVLAAATALALPTLAQGAEPEKVQFKQSSATPRDIPVQSPTASATPSQESVAFHNYQETLKSWRSARKRLGALESVGKTLQGDPAADKEVVALIQLMAIEKTQEVEQLRVQLAAILLTTKIEDPELPSQEREIIVLRAR